KNMHMLKAELVGKFLWREDFLPFGLFLQPLCLFRSTFIFKKSLFLRFPLLLPTLALRLSLLLPPLPLGFFFHGPTLFLGLFLQFSLVFTIEMVGEFRGGFSY